MANPTISLVITTCALLDGEVPLSSGKQPHAFRAYLLRNFLLPQAIASGVFREIFVVGEFEAGPSYTHLDVPSVERSSIHDSLRKRQAGTDAATGDWIVVQNDDHLWDAHAFTNARPWMLDNVADVISPARWTRLRGVAGERLNGGEPGNPWSGAGHVCGHGAIYKANVLRACPWSALPKIFSYDVAHSEAIRNAGYHIVWADNVKVWDVEEGATPWK